jgi:hypothetical protein
LSRERIVPGTARQNRPADANPTTIYWSSTTLTETEHGRLPAAGFVFFILAFVSLAVALHTILKLQYFPFHVDLFDLCWLMLVAIVAGVGLQIAAVGVASRAAVFRSPVCDGKPGVLKCGAAPGVRGMALGTVSAEFSLVGRRFSMATAAGLWRALEDLVSVTRFTIRQPMFACELETGLVMIEFAQTGETGFPAVRGVAVAARGAKFPLVHGGFGVAGCAHLRGSLIGIILVARLAIEVLVLAG